MIVNTLHSAYPLPSIRMSSYKAMIRELISTYLWTSVGKITGGEIEDDIAGVLLEAGGSTVKTAVFKGVEESVGSAVASVFATDVEASVGNAIDAVVAEGVGNTVAGVRKGRPGAAVFHGTGK